MNLEDRALIILQELEQEGCSPEQAAEIGLIVWENAGAASDPEDEYLDSWEPEGEPN